MDAKRCTEVKDLSEAGKLQRWEEVLKGRAPRPDAAHNRTRRPADGMVDASRQHATECDLSEFAHIGDRGPRRGKTASGARIEGERDRVVGVLDGRVRDSRDELRSLVQAAASVAVGRRRELSIRASHVRLLS